MPLLGISDVQLIGKDVDTTKGGIENTGEKSKMLSHIVSMRILDCYRLISPGTRERDPSLSAVVPVLIEH